MTSCLMFLTLTSLPWRTTPWNCEPQWTFSPLCCFCKCIHFCSTTNFQNILVLNTQSLYYPWNKKVISLFLDSLIVLFCSVSEFTYSGKAHKWNQTVLVFLCLAYCLRIISLSIIHVVTYAKIHVKKWMIIFCASIWYHLHTQTSMNIQVVSAFWAFWFILLWIWKCSRNFKMLFLRSYEWQLYWKWTKL